MKPLACLICLLLSGCISFQKADDLSARIRNVEGSLAANQREITTLADINEANEIEWVKNTAVNQMWPDTDLFDTMASVKKRMQAQREIAESMSRDRMELAEIRYELGGVTTE